MSESIHSVSGITVGDVFTDKRKPGREITVIGFEQCVEWHWAYKDGHRHKYAVKIPEYEVLVRTTKSPTGRMASNAAVMPIKNFKRYFAPKEQS